MRPTFPVRRAPGFVRDTRGGAGIEFAVGAVAVLGIAAMGFDLYQRIEAGAAGARMAAAMADYVSRETAPDGDQMTALAEFMRAQEIGAASDAVYAVSVIRRSPDDPDAAPKVRWVDTIRFGDETATESLASACGNFGAENGPAKLPQGFALAAGETVVAAEVCARLREQGTITRLFEAGDVYGVHMLPVREPDTEPARPTRGAA